MRLLTAIAIALCASGCSHPAATVHVDVGATFRLAPGEVAAVGDEALLIGFREVLGDSRCPITVVCVWQGDAEVLMQTASGGDGWSPTTLHTGVEPRTRGVDGFLITLVQVEPAPLETPIDPGDYRITVTVEEDS